MNVSLLKRADFFRLNFSRECLEELALHVQEETCSPGDVLVQQAQPVHKLMLLVKGCCRFEVPARGTGAGADQNEPGAQSGSWVDAGPSAEGEILALACFVADRTSEYRVRCASCVQLASIPRSAFLSVLGRFQQDFEMFHLARHGLLQGSSCKLLRGVACKVCASEAHSALCSCSGVFFAPARYFTISKLLQSDKPQGRQAFLRKCYQYCSALGSKALVVDSLVALMINSAHGCSEKRIEEVIQTIDCIYASERQTSSSQLSSSDKARLFGQLNYESFSESSSVIMLADKGSIIAPSQESSSKAEERSQHSQKHQIMQSYIQQPKYPSDIEMHAVLVDEEQSEAGNVEDLSSRDGLQAPDSQVNRRKNRAQLRASECTNQRRFQQTQKSL